MRDEGKPQGNKMVGLWMMSKVFMSLMPCGLESM